jgi:hypothetical protein
VHFWTVIEEAAVGGQGKGRLEQDHAGALSRDESVLYPIHASPCQASFEKSLLIERPGQFFQFVSDYLIGIEEREHGPIGDRLAHPCDDAQSAR